MNNKTLYHKRCLIEILETINRELFSCLKVFEDYSPEEVRLAVYNARKSNNLAQVVSFII
jgi:hypothetical protein